MTTSMLTLIVNARSVAGLLAVCIIIIFVSTLPRACRMKNQVILEPPMIRSGLPFLGHAIQLLRYGSLYFRRIRYGSHTLTSQETDGVDEYSEYKDFPIYTLQILNGRMYVVNDAYLASAVQRRTDAFSFDPFMVMAAEKLAGTTPEVSAIVRHDIASGSHGQGLVGGARDRLHRILNSSSDLELMARDMFQHISVHINQLEHEAEVDGSHVDLSSWVKKAVSLASTNTIYGPKNPFSVDPEVCAAFWDYESNLSLLLVNYIPKVIATRAYVGRETLAKAFTRYFESGCWSQGSSLIQANYHANSERSVSTEDQARFELTTCIGLLINTVPAVSWMLVHVLSRPALLDDLRSELLASGIIDVEEHVCGRKSLVLCTTTLKSRCPLLNSTYREVLRYHATSLTARYVTKDTILDGRYLLKAGSIVQIPAAVVHRDERLWGKDASEFVAARFCSENQEALQRPSAASRAFGGGSTLCPGRNFATNEILMLVAVFILRFNVDPVSGSWPSATASAVNLTNSIMPPPQNLRVKVTKSGIIDQVEWSLR